MDWKHPTPTPREFLAVDQFENWVTFLFWLHHLSIPLKGRETLAVHVNSNQKRDCQVTVNAVKKKKKGVADNPGIYPSL